MKRKALSLLLTLTLILGLLPATALAAGNNYPLTLEYPKDLCTVTVTGASDQTSYQSGAMLPSHNGDEKAYYTFKIESIKDGYRIKSVRINRWEHTTYRETNEVLETLDEGLLWPHPGEEVIIQVEIEKVPSVLPELSGVKLYAGDSLTEPAEGDIPSGVDVYGQAVFKDGTVDPVFYTVGKWEYSLDGTRWSPYTYDGAAWYYPGLKEYAVYAAEISSMISNIKEKDGTDQFDIRLRLEPRKDYAVGEPVYSKAIHINGGASGGGETPCAHANTEIKNVKAAACTTAGYTGDTVCKDCGKTVSTGKAVDALGHDWNNGVITKEPAAGADGIKTYTCKREGCGATRTEAVKASNDGIGSGTTINPDGSKTTVETKEDGTVITTTVDLQGNETKTEKKPDGSNGVTVTNAAGRTTATVHLPSAVASMATGRGSAVTLPVQGIRPSRDIGKAPAVTVNTSGINGVKAVIPVDSKSAGTVAVLIKAGGIEQIIKNTVPTQNGIEVRVNSGDTVKILDNGKSFADTKGHWAGDAVVFASSRELFNGTSPDRFSPNAKMTRGMLVTVLARYEDVDTQGGSTWYEKGAAWAKANGLSDGTNLNGNITREQLATIMYRYADFQGKLNSTDVGLHGYTDAGRISSWAADAMAWAVGVGLIQGTTPTTLDSQGSATRGQVATIIMRYAEMFGS